MWLRGCWRYVVSSSEQMRFHPTAERVYRYIVRYKKLYGGASPTLREIAAAAGLRTVSAVSPHLDTLESAGRIRRVRRGKARMIDVPGGRWVFDEVGAAEKRQNNCALSADGDAAGSLEEERKVSERLGENGY
jgi:SOS-response transcriptional repressor LexA